MFIDESEFVRFAAHRANSTARRIVVPTARPISHGLRPGVAATLANVLESFGARVLSHH